MTSRPARVIGGSVVALGATLAVVAAVYGDRHQGARKEDGSEAGSADARPVQMPRDPGRYAPDAAYYVQCSNVLDEGGVPTDWPGWRRVAGIEDACCILDSPTNLGGSIPQLTWHECASATGVTADAYAGCGEADGFDGTDAAPVLFDLEVSLDSGGRPELILLGRAIDEPNSGDAEYEVYDFGSGRPLAAWRNKIAPSISSCIVLTDVANSIETIAASLYGPGDVLYASGPPAALVGTAEFLRLRGVPWQLAVQKHGTSSTTFAFDLAPAGIVDRVRIGASLVGTTAGRGGPPIFFDFAHKEDVFAATGSGWTSEYVVGADGTPAVLRGVENRHVLGFATDGDTLFWLEAFGGADPVALPLKFEVWAAPYTTDPHKLERTARKLGAARGQGFAGGRAAADGTYAVVTGNCAQVARASGGEVRELCSPPDALPGGPISMIPGELWRILRLKGATRRTVLRRFALPR